MGVSDTTVNFRKIPQNLDAFVAQAQAYYIHQKSKTNFDVSDYTFIAIVALLFSSIGVAQLVGDPNENPAAFTFGMLSGFFISLVILRQGLVARERTQLNQRMTDEFYAMLQEYAQYLSGTLYESYARAVQPYIEQSNRIEAQMTLLTDRLDWSRKEYTEQFCYRESISTLLELLDEKRTKLQIYIKQERAKVDDRVLQIQALPARVMAEQTDNMLEHLELGLAILDEGYHKTLSEFDAMLQNAALGSGHVDDDLAKRIDDAYASFVASNQQEDLTTHSSSQEPDETVEVFAQGVRKKNQGAKRKKY